MFVRLIIAAFLAIAGWQLYRAIRTGRIQVTMGGTKANRQDTPIIYWFFTGVLAFIVLNLAGALASAFGITLPRL